jgi:CheY-like chemotaxis protein
MQMPGLSGWTWCAVCAASQAVCTRVALTAFAEKYQRQAYLEAELPITSKASRDQTAAGAGQLYLGQV